MPFGGCATAISRARPLRVSIACARENGERRALSGCREKRHLPLADRDCKVPDWEGVTWPRRRLYHAPLRRDSERLRFAQLVRQKRKHASRTHHDSAVCQSRGNEVCSSIVDERHGHGRNTDRDARVPLACRTGIGRHVWRLSYHQDRSGSRDPMPTL